MTEQNTTEPAMNKKAKRAAKKAAMNKKAKRAAKKAANAPETRTPADAATINRLSEFSKAKTAREAKVRETMLGNLPPLPKMPKGPRKPRPPQPCACGCAEPTKGGRFIPGHDARLHAWALRVEKEVIKLSEVPDVHRKAVAALLKLDPAMRTKTGQKKAATEQALQKLAEADTDPGA